MTIPRLSDIARATHQQFNTSKPLRGARVTFGDWLAAERRAGKAYKREGEKYAAQLVSDALAALIASARRPIVLSQEDRRALRDLLVLEAELACELSPTS